LHLANQFTVSSYATIENVDQTRGHRYHIPTQYRRQKFDGDDVRPHQTEYFANRDRPDDTRSINNCE